MDGKLSTCICGWIDEQVGRWTEGSLSPYQGVGRCRESKGMARGRAEPHPALGESGQDQGEACRDGRATHGCARSSSRSRSQCSSAHAGNRGCSPGPCRRSTAGRCLGGRGAQSGEAASFSHLSQLPGCWECARAQEPTANWDPPLVGSTSAQGGHSTHQSPPAWNPRLVPQPTPLSHARGLRRKGMTANWFPPLGRRPSWALGR